MSFMSRTVTTYSNELTFIKQFINDFSASSNRITCTTTDIDDQFLDTTGYPSFTFLIDNTYELTFTRSHKLSTSTTGYAVSSTIPGTSTSIKSLLFSASGSNTIAYNATKTRVWKFEIASNSKVLHIRLGDRGTDMRNPQTQSQKAFDIISIVDGSLVFGAYKALSSSNPSIMDASFYDHSGSSVGSVDPIDRLLYTYNSNNISQIDIINNKIFAVAETSDRIFTTTALVDCSATTINQIITVNSIRYYCIDDHTLFEI